MCAEGSSSRDRPGDRKSELRAVLWDMDGTLVDSEPLWAQEERLIMERAGLSWTAEDAAGYIGQAVDRTAEGMIARGLLMAHSELVAAVIDGVAAALRRELPWRPGARELVTGTRPLRSALVTMSHRTVADALLSAVPGVFDAVVTGDAVERGKPDPEPYLSAAAALGVDPSQCVAFEDSLPGVASATSAGIVTVGVEGAVPLGGSGADEVIGGFERLGAEDLYRIHARHAR